MSLIGLITRESPTLGIEDGTIVEFDAVLEDTLEAEITYTQYPIELGASASDHAIIEPVKWTLVGALSNNPVSVGVMDFAGGLISNLTDSGTAAAALGYAGGIAGYLGGSEQTRSQEALAFLLALMRERKPFSVNAGDITLENMVITKISRTKTAENESGLEFRAELIEIPLIELVIKNNQPKQSNLRPGDPAQSQAAADVSLGETMGKTSTIDLGAVQ